MMTTSPPPKLMMPMIRASLRLGGLVLAERRTGKTTALMDLAMSNPYYRVMTCSSDMRRHIMSQWKIRDPIKVIERSGLEKLRGIQFDAKEHLLVDEYFYCGYEGPFLAAVGTPPFPIRPVTLTNLPKLDPVDVISGIFDGYLPAEEATKQLKMHQPK